MGSLFSRSHTTVVANGYSKKDIFVRVSDANGCTKVEQKKKGGFKRAKIDLDFGARIKDFLPKINFKFRFGWDKKSGGSKGGKEDGSSHQKDDGYISIKPGEAFAFYYDRSVSHVFVTIFKKKRNSQKLKITKNLKMLRNHNLVVDADRHAKNTREGEIWIDTDGKDHLKIHQNNIKKKKRSKYI